MKFPDEGYETCVFTCTGPWDESVDVEIDVYNKSTKRMPGAIVTVMRMKPFVKTGSKTVDDSVIKFEEVLPEKYRPVVDTGFIIQTCHLKNNSEGYMKITPAGEITICATHPNINGGKYRRGDLPQGFYDAVMKYVSKLP